MFDIFSTREVAIGIWLIACFIVAFIMMIKHKNIKASIKLFLCDAISIKLVIPILFFLIYSVITTSLFSLLSIWKSIFIKDIVLWTLFVGIPLYYGAIMKNIDKSYYKKALIRNLKLIVFVEFIIVTFTLNIVVELIIIPVVTCITIVSTFADTRKDGKKAANFLSWLLTILGFCLLALAINKAIADYNMINGLDFLISIVMPLILSVIYLPITYIFALYAKYETTFMRMKQKESNVKKIQIKHRFKLIKACKLSYKKVVYFELNLWKDMYQNMDEKEFDDLLKSI